MSKKDHYCPVCEGGMIFDDEVKRLPRYVCGRCGFSTIPNADSYTEEEVAEQFERRKTLFQELLAKAFYSNVKAVEIPKLNFLLDETAKGLSYENLRNISYYKELTDLFCDVMARGRVYEKE